MKKYILLIFITAGIIACNKTTTLPKYSSPTTTNLKVTSLKHTADTVNVGDTIYLSAAGSVYDTTAVYAYFTVTSSATGSPSYTIGSVSAPILVAATLASRNVSGMNDWTATIPLTKLTSVSKSKLTITATFLSQLTLSSQGSNTVTITDSGQINKTVYVQ